MSSSVHSIQAAHAQTQAEQSVQPPKTLQTEAASQTAVPKDTVSISQQARQALANDTRRAGDVNHDGNT
ncbi:MAG TPA: hypothetical protein VK709_08630 [Candidatus Saccharimonadales bacterium]|jgi:hypothetical protein|nr:hypothetical protein [Candidatus Saccharimonadales bacterium]